MVFKKVSLIGIALVSFLAIFGCQEDDTEDMVSISFTDLITISNTGSLGASGDDFSVTNVSYNETVTNYVSSSSLFTQPSNITGTADVSRTNSILRVDTQYLDEDGYWDYDSFSWNLSGDTIVVPDGSETDPDLDMTVTLTNGSGSINYAGQVITVTGDYVISFPQSLLSGAYASQASLDAVLKSVEQKRNSVVKNIIKNIQAR